MAYDPGHYYPHHNLYYITSTTWDLEVLGGLFSSRVAHFMLSSYAVKLRGGYLRCQAQYLRRIRLPVYGSLAPALRQEIAEAFHQRDQKQLDELALEAYGIQEQAKLPVLDTRA